VQIYKNYGGHKVFVSSVQIELINSVYRITQIIVPSLKITMVYLLSQMEL
jgi:hypothetical protein